MPLDAHFGVRAYSRYVIARYLDVQIEGVENVAAHGPVMLAARHYHHLYDGAVMVGKLARNVRIFVALDWVESPRTRSVMETLCTLARFPIALRADGFRDGAAGAFTPRERITYLRRALGEATQLLREGEVVAVFPEGYPTIDPVTSRKPPDGWLPFAPGFLSIVEAAQREGVRVPIVPVGFTYTQAGQRTQVRMRLGAPSVYEPGFDRTAVARAIEARVRGLS